MGGARRSQGPQNSSGRVTSCVPRLMSGDFLVGRPSLEVREV